MKYCKACAYISRIGGCAMTKRSCNRCGKEIHFANTCTDKYCTDCAKILGVCAKCGEKIGG